MHHSNTGKLYFFLWLYSILTPNPKSYKLDCHPMSTAVTFDSQGNGCFSFFLRRIFSSPMFYYDSCTCRMLQYSSQCYCILLGIPGADCSRIVPFGTAYLVYSRCKFPSLQFKTFFKQSQNKSRLAHIPLLGFLLYFLNYLRR